MNQAIRTGALVAFLAIAGYAALQVGALAKGTIALVRDLRANSESIAKSAEASSNSLQIALGHIGDIELETQRTEAEMAGLLNQTRHSMLTAPEKAELLGKANAILDDADAAVKETNLDLVKVGRDLDTADRVLADSDAFVGTAQVSVGRLDETLVPVAESMQKLDVTMSDIAATAADGRMVADHYTKIILAPASKVKSATLFLASVAGRVLRIL